MKRASRNNTSFRKTIQGQDLTFQLSSKDGVARHYIVKNSQVHSVSGAIIKPTFELVFFCAAKGFEILTHKNAQAAFMRGVQEQDIIASGDLSKIMWFQAMTSALKNAYF